MALPEFIEIVPLDKPIRAEITVPGSKSITNRALILAALAEGETTLEGALWSEDTEVMVESLRDLGFMVNLETDPNEPCNRTITVYGKGGVVPSGGTESQPLDLFVGNAGTAARFLAAFVCLGTGVYRLHGAPRMHDRPQAELFSALRQLGYHIESENNNEKLPAKITVAASSGVASRLGLQGGRPAGAAAGCSVRIGQSSQFASALILCAQAGNWNVRIEGENAEESPYVVMTSELIKVFPKQGGTFRIEPDASSGSYFLAAELLVPRVYSEGLEYSLHWKMDVETTLFSKVSVAHWPTSGWQADQRFPNVITWLQHTAIRDFAKDPGTLDQVKTQMRILYPDGQISRKKHLGDSIMTAIILAPFAESQIQFTDLGRLRVQECERVVALKSELTKCGAKVLETGDTLEVFPSQLHGAEIETYNDHRMAMCFAILGLKIPGIKIKNPACVKKTFPNFFQKLAEPPPHGLGTTIRDAATGRALGPAELFAQ